MKIQNVIEYISKQNFGKNITINKLQKFDFVMLNITNESNKKSITVGFHEDNYFIDEYEGEIYYDYTQEGLDDCIKQIKREIEFSADIYGYNKDDEYIYHNKICVDGLSSNILRKWCEIALEHDSQLKRILASNFNGNLVLEFVVENGQLVPLILPKEIK